MKIVSIDEAKVKLLELIHILKPGGEVLITENNQPVARLTRSVPHAPRQLGTLKGIVTQMAADFDAPLDEFTNSRTKQRES